MLIIANNKENLIFQLLKKNIILNIINKNKVKKLSKLLQIILRMLMVKYYKNNKKFLLEILNIIYGT